MNCHFPLNGSECIGNYAIALLIARLFLGFLFFFQGYDKIFNVKIQGVVDAFQSPMQSHHITKSLLYLAAFYTSWAEFMGGFLLILGLFKLVALSMLGVDLLFVAIAFGVIRPMWDMQYVFPRLALLIFLLLMPACFDSFSLDFILFCK